MSLQPVLKTLAVVLFLAVGISVGMLIRTHQFSMDTAVMLFCDFVFLWIIFLNLKEL